MDIYERPAPKPRLLKQFETTLPEDDELKPGSKSSPPEDWSFVTARLYSNWINLYRFLKDVFALDMDEDHQRYYMRSSSQFRFPGDRLAKVAYEAVNNPDPSILDKGRSLHPRYYSPHAFIGRHSEEGKKIGFHHHRRNDHMARYNALVVDIDDGPDREALEEKFERLELRPHYFIKTRPFDNNFQLVFKLDPIRLGEGNRPQTLSKIGYMLSELYELFGGDPHAAKANQLYRLPYTYRNDLKEGYEVQVIDRSNHSPYDLGEVDERLEGATKDSFSTLIRYEYGEASKGDVLDSPPIKKIREGMIPYGHRNASLTALSYAYAMDDYSVEKAVEELVEWAETHTEGGYGDHPSGKSQEPPEIVINQCYANPKGLNWEELAAIETLEDGRIGDRCAKKVLKYMPKTKQVHERKPPEELENDRFFMSVEKVLRTIYELQREQEEKGEPVTLKVDELAEKSGVSRGTLTNRINPSLNELQIKTKYSNRPNKFNLTQGKYPYKTYTFIRRGMYNSSKDTKVALWYSRFPEEFGRFKGLLDEINEWVKEVNGEKAENRADQIADPEDLELDPELKGHIKMAKQHGWEEVKAVLAHNDKNVKRVKQAIEKYAPEVEL